MRVRVCVSLTAQLVPRPGEHVVEDVEGPLVFGLADGAGLLQQVWGQRSRSAPHYHLNTLER